VIASAHTGTLCGVDASGVRVEVDFARGLPGFDIVGLPEAAARESQVRVRAAIANSSFKLLERAFVVNLAPADVRKSGSSFDLAIAVALLSKCGFCAPDRLEETLIVGELSLDTVSDVGLVGGGAPIRPGEVTLSHLGVLFLDELPEFRRTAIESLRPIIESGVSFIVRAAERTADNGRLRKTSRISRSTRRSLGTGLQKGLRFTLNPRDR
jgi:predicted ATPase with chaperone activity